MIQSSTVLYFLQKLGRREPIKKQRLENQMMIFLRKYLRQMMLRSRIPQVRLPQIVHPRKTITISIPRK
ncbi:predicted protein [Botrytis cinerea T4]|uniref:Uncharacterized protein n=1 Tax=Botryotinia fuckeliana (strain T4) TaxID=999810 RepID=G2Y7X5_BOTF4|nr:predicted protein [Botrytis cinerea T4]